jgi:putative restriction endonuclease
VSAPDLDARVRLRAFEFLEEQTRILGDVLPHRVLKEGFLFEGTRVHLVSRQGIFKPAILPEIPLTITTAPTLPGKPPPYHDFLGDDGFLRYRYRGNDANHRENVGLRLAMARKVPLIYFRGIVTGEYLARWPVFVVHSNPMALTFTIAVDDMRYLGDPSPPESDTAVQLRRAYHTRLTYERVHQRTFQRQVLLAYQERCAVCRLHQRRLLDAAHILPDTHPRGEPVVPNGLALCKLHHAAFDGNILGVRPDLKIDLKLHLLDDADGPMLEHGLKDFQGGILHVPRPASLRPDRGLLEERYALFRKAG